jgi:polyisoprenyl-phosphate glycosyltransferase
MTKKLISVVAPAYQEEGTVRLFVEKVLEAIASLEQYRWEIILVDDGSEDGTLDILKGLRLEDARIKWMALSRNFGHQTALTAGVQRAGGDAVIMMDSDLQHPVGILPQLLKKWEEGYDLVITVRREDKRLSLVKRVTSRMFYRILNVMSGVPMREGSADFRLMSRKAVGAFLRFGEVHRFIRGMVAWMGFSVAEVAFYPDERAGGRTKYSLARMIRFALDGITSFSIVPLRLITLLGSVICLLTVLYILYVVFIWFHRPDELLAGWTSLIISVNLIGGVILLALGMIGEYIGRIYQQVKERPLYLVREEAGFDRSPSEN